MEIVHFVAINSTTGQKSKIFLDRGSAIRAAEAMVWGIVEEIKTPVPDWRCSNRRIH